MASKTVAIAWSVLGVWLMSVCGVSAATSPETVTLGYASFSGHYTPMWIAVEDGLGKKYGIDLKAVYAGHAQNDL